MLDWVILMLSLSWSFWFRTLDISLPGMCYEMSEPTHQALSLPYQRDLMLGELGKLNDPFLMIVWLTQTKRIWCLIMRVNELLSWKRTCLELISRLMRMCWLKPCHFRLNLSHLKSKSYAHDSSFIYLIESCLLVVLETC